MFGDKKAGFSSGTPDCTGEEKDDRLGGAGPSGDIETDSDSGRGERDPFPEMGGDAV